MKLITDLHPCCKCNTWQDIDTLNIYVVQKKTFEVKTGMICQDCNRKLDNSLNYSIGGISWVTQKETP